MTQSSSRDFAGTHWFRWIVGPIFGVTCLLATCTGVLVLIVLLGSILTAALSGLPDSPWYAFSAQIKELFHLLERVITQGQSTDPTEAGYRVGIAGSLWLICLVALIAIPVGVGAGVYLEEYAPPGRLRRLIAGAFTLSLLILPVIVLTTQESLRSVPPSLRQAALALGATRWQMVRDHVLPSALPGIMTGTILGLSRAIGETAPLLMVGAAGSILRMPRGPLDRYSALPVQIYSNAQEANPLFQSVAAGGILVLVSLLLVMNASAIMIRNHFRRYH
jgi:phosphate transport system permease protein